VAVKVRFYGRFREIAGINEIKIDGKNLSLEKLMEKISNFIPQLEDELRCGKIGATIFIAVNNVLVNPDKSSPIVIEDGSQVDIMPPPSGG